MSLSGGRPRGAARVRVTSSVRARRASATTRLHRRTVRSHRPVPAAPAGLVCPQLGGVVICSQVSVVTRQLQKSSCKGLAERVAATVIGQVASALRHLHAAGACHRDVKPENVLYVDGACTRVKLCDFGFAVICSSDRRLKTVCGTPQYMAPEIWRADPGGTYAGPPVDMWSLGALAYEALSPGFQEMLETLKARHSSRHVFGAQARYSEEVSGRIGNPEKAVQDSLHPVVIRHPDTGRKILYVNPGFTIGIEGWREPESKALLGFLYHHAQQPQFQVRFDWQPGSVALWDNRTTWHNAVNDYPGQRRLMHRATIEGTPLR